MSDLESIVEGGVACSRLSDNGGERRKKKIKVGIGDGGAGAGEREASAHFCHLLG